ncbi:hypothetical protein NE237_007026 [Protea cynaroides]|uniref:Uncharacterized protein n=1 Tax=Protea cynaroides TaxID=273540 RepID=A0A9Q0KNG0_9MAGN|nr:hypothetical protein NE237_007026 [Protea cynaroides]
MYVSDEELQNNISIIGKLFRILSERKPRLDNLLDSLFLQSKSDTLSEAAAQDGVASGTQNHSSKAEEKNSKRDVGDAAKSFLSNSKASAVEVEGEGDDGIDC